MVRDNNKQSLLLQFRWMTSRGPGIFDRLCPPSMGVVNRVHRNSTDFRLSTVGLPEPCFRVPN
jgi:hypothetical protein